MSLSKSERKKHHFNYFTVDFDEELSAFSGQYLERQTSFMEHVVRRIFECYTKAHNKPTSLIAIGHSMGGIVLRGLIRLPSFDYRKINTLINLATPHRRPIINIDPVLNQYYKNLDKAWLKDFERFENITFMSFGGGFRDFLVRSDLCLMDQSKNHFSMITSSLPNIWLSNDHQCIVWCNELVRALTRMFFQMANPSTRQIYHSPNVRTKILKRVFLHSEKLKTRVNKFSADDASLCTLLTVNESVALNKDGGCYQLFAKHGEIIDIWFNSNVDKGLVKIFTCISNSLRKDGQCSSVPITKYVQGGSKFISLTSKKDVFFYLVLSNRPGVIITKRSSAENLKLRLSPFVDKTETLALVSKTFYTEISLIGFTATWQCYSLQINFNPRDFGAKDECFVTAEIENESTGELYVSKTEPGDSRQGTLRISLKFFTEPPKPNHALKLRVWSKSMFSSLTVDVDADLMGTLGQIVRFNPGSLVRYILVLYIVLKETRSLGTFVFIFIILRTGLSWWITNIADTATRGKLKDVISSSGDDFFETVLDSIVVESCLVGIALSLAHIMAFILNVLIYVIERILCLRFLFLTKNDDCSNERTYASYAVLSFFVVYIGCLYKLYGACPVLVSCLVVHLFRDILYNTNSEKESITVFLPMTVFSISVPTVLTVKHILNGYGYPNAGEVLVNANVDHLAFSYVVFLVLRQLLLFTVAGKDIFRSNVKQALLVIVCLCFVLEECLNFYNLPYLVIFCMVLRVF